MKLSPEARAARNKYLSNWKKNNPEKVKKHQESYWERVADRAEKEAAQEG